MEDTSRSLSIMPEKQPNATSPQQRAMTCLHLDGNLTQAGRVQVRSGTCPQMWARGRENQIWESLQSSSKMSKTVPRSLLFSIWGILFFICRLMGLAYLRKLLKLCCTDGSFDAVTILKVTTYIPALRSDKCLPKSRKFSDWSVHPQDALDGVWYYFLCKFGRFM